MSKVIKYVGLAFVIFVLILLIVPVFIPMEHYKGQARDAVKRLTGRDLVIDGDIKLSLLPQPTISLGNVKLASVPGASFPDMLRVKEAKASLSLTSLLSGKVAIASLKLISPELVLEELKTGEASWVFNLSGTAPATEQVVDKPARQQSFELPIGIEHIVVQHGKVTYIEPDKQFTVEDIDLNLKTVSPKGPIDFSTSLKAFGEVFYLSGEVKEFREHIQIATEVDALDTKLTIDGDIDPLGTRFKGKVILHGKLDKLEEYVAVPKGWKNVYNFNTDIEASRKQLNFNEIKFVCGQTTAEGKGGYSFTDEAGNVKLAVLPGDISLDLVLQRREKEITSNIHIKTSSVIPLLKSLDIDMSALPDLLSKKLEFSTSALYLDQEITLKNMLLQAAGATAQGGVKLKNFASPSLSYDLHTDNAGSFIKAAGVKLPIKLASISIKGGLSKNGNNFSTNTTLTAAKASVNVKGNINRDRPMDTDLNLAMESQNLGQTLEQLFGSSYSQLGALSLFAHLKGDLAKEAKLDISKSSLVMAVDKTDLSGNVNINMKGEKPNFNARLQASVINLNAFDSQKTLPVASPNTTRAAGASNAHWSSDKIDLSFLNLMDGTLDLTVQKMVKGELVFDSINLKSSISKGILNIDPLTGNLYGGQVRLVASLPSGTKQTVTFKGGVKDANLKNITPEGRKIKVTKGTVTVNADLKTSGESQMQYIRNLSGAVDLKGTDGILSGVNLQKIVDSLNNIKNLEGVLRILDSSFSGGETEYKNLTGVVSINQGVANITQGTLEASGGRIGATGSVNLPEYYMDIAAKVETDVKGMPPFGARLYGPLDNPQHKLDTAALKQHILKNVINKVMDTIKEGGKPEDVLKNLLGGKRPKQPTEGENQPESATNNDNQQQPQDKTNNPVEDVMKKGLEGLFK